MIQPSRFAEISAMPLSPCPSKRRDVIGKTIMDPPPANRDGLSENL
jgi:hypothetical protein